MHPSDIAPGDRRERKVISMKGITRVAVAVLMVGGVAGAFAPAAHADDAFCSNGTVEPGGREVSVLGGKPSDPLTIGVQVYPGTAYTRIVACYGSDDAAAVNPLLAGSIEIDNWNGSSGVSGYAYCDRDDTSPASPTCQYNYGVAATPSITPTTGPSGIGLTASVPFAVENPEVGAEPAVLFTGLIVGTLVAEPIPAGATGARYRLTQTEVWVNGTKMVGGDSVPVGGGYVVTANPLTNTAGVSTTGGGTCVAGSTCPKPFGKLALNGADSTATLVLPVAGAVPVTVPVPAQCIISFDGPC